MTAPHIVDPAGLLGEALFEASPDLKRSRLQTMIAGVHLFRGILPSAVYPGMFVPIFRDFGWMP